MVHSVFGTALQMKMVVHLFVERLGFLAQERDVLFDGLALHVGGLSEVG